MLLPLLVVVGPLLTLLQMAEMRPLSAHDGAALLRSRRDGQPAPGDAAAGGIFGPDGIVQPPAFYQRFRRSEYPRDKPYFQWWYFCLKDTALGRYAAITYAYSESSNSSTAGAFLGVAMVDSVTNSRFVRTHQMPLSAFRVLQSGDMGSTAETLSFNVSVEDPASGSFYELSLADPTSTTIRIRGHMSGHAPLYFYDSSGPVDPLTPRSPVVWDATIDRIYGWYGQSAFEEYTHEMFPVISWNTYSHNSAIRPGGFLSFGSAASPTMLRFGDKPATDRAYADMNWGRTFPSPPPFDPHDRSFAWGWYDVVLPAGPSSPGSSDNDDIAIIAGIGECYTGAPLFTVVGSFADLRLSSALEPHIGIRSLTVWNNTLDPIMLSTDGTLRVFTVDRSQWTTITDSMGSADIPLVQVVTMETDHYQAILNFTSSVESYNRLLFPFENFIFSDFEALGVPVHVQINVRAEVDAPFQPAMSFEVSNGGLEFGYRVL